MKAANKVHQILKDSSGKMTLAEIQKIAETLQASEISMALCYLMRQRYLSRELVENTSKGRKQIWLYTYHAERLPK